MGECILKIKFPFTVLDSHVVFLLSWNNPGFRSLHFPKGLVSGKSLHKSIVGIREIFIKAIHGGPPRYHIPRRKKLKELEHMCRTEHPRGKTFCAATQYWQLVLPLCTNQDVSLKDSF